ncbi:MAG: hypothetical protein J3Q66DRAFT_439242 [Benniella sp.]|nr:MAG: hypothetical protein J3Q66DRAFT_439242 [Benniella sp.]
MGSPVTNNNFVQEFRSCMGPASSISPGIKKIPARFDKTTGQHVILWKHIVLAFKGAESVMKDDTLVPFMTDDDGFEDLEPLRIPYHPGVILDVVVPDFENHALVKAKPSTTAPDAMTSEGSSELIVQGRTDITSVVQQIANLSIATTEAVDKSLVIQSAFLDKEDETPFQQHDQPNTALWRANIPAQNIQIPPVDDYINDQLRRMGTNGIQEGDLFQMHTLHLLQQMLDKQQQTLNRQVILENRVQALMTQNYELHEYPIPRLFIVLPKRKKHRDKFIHPFKRQFRLYFLCECGEHTKGASRGSLPNKIHLAKHEGYDLDQPNEFFERYGSYVMAMLRFLKYGTMAAGIAVPPLALFKVVEGLDAIQKSLTATTDGIKSLVDETIKHIQNLQGNSPNDRGTATGPMALDDIEALEGADLRQLQLYLNDKDKGRVLGDLFRIFTPEGHVKWVCIDHYKENYRKTAIHRLKEVIAANKGSLDRYTNKLFIRLGYNTAAEQFYEALVKARGIQTLEITLEWNITLDDLRKLASAVSKANINQLTLHRSLSYKEPILDMINNGRRYNPIVEMMCNGRLQEMTLEVEFDDFFKRIDFSSTITTSRLQKLSFISRSRPLFKPELVKLLKHLPRLVELRLEVFKFNEIFESVTESLSFLPCLVDLSLEKEPYLGRIEELVAAKISQSKIQSLKVKTKDIDSPDIALILQRSNLTELEINANLSTQAENGDGPSIHRFVGRLNDMMRRRPKLCYVELGCSLEDSQDVIDAISSTRERILSEGGSCGLRRVKLHVEPTSDFVLDDDLVISPWKPNKFTVVLEFQDGFSAPFISTIVDTEGHDWVTYESVSDFLTQFGSSLSVLKPRVHDEAAVILDKVTPQNTSRITSLVINTRSLTMIGLEAMVNVIDRSYDLQQLEFTFVELHEAHRQEMLELLIRRHGRRLTRLEMIGESADVWIPKIMALCPTRLELPMLESFSLDIVDDESQLGPGCFQWIISMVSAKSQAPSMIMSSLSTRLTIATASKSPSHEWRPLSDVKLHCLPLKPKEWEVIFQAMDYSSLRNLGIRGEKFSMELLKLLVDSIPVNSNPVATLFIDIYPLHVDEEWESHVTRLRSKVPTAIVSEYGDDDYDEYYEYEQNDGFDDCIDFEDYEEYD